MEHYPKVSVHGEIMPSEILHRGGIRTISDEILRIQDRHKAQVGEMGSWRNGVNHHYFFPTKVKAVEPRSKGAWYEFAQRANFT